jgi:glycosyltransferase involved in cell wall biosynthesis
MIPLLSIVVPTKNRYEYLKHCLSTLLEIKSNDIEIVIQDNSDDNTDFLNYLNEQDSENLKYFYTKTYLSVVENCDLGIKNSTGEFVCMLGDDDSVAERIIDVTRWMKKNAIESCLGGIARYNWPDLVYKYHKFHSLVIPSTNIKFRILDVKQQLYKCLSIGAREMGLLPKVYHAVVSKEALTRLYNLAGTYFPGPSPDMANAIALCYILKNHVYLNYPIIVSGFSYKSGGGMGTRGKHIGEIKSMKHLPPNTDELWEPRIPKVWTAEAIYAESALKAIRALRVEDVSRFNYSNFYAAFICYNWKCFLLILPYVRSFKTIFFVTAYSIKIMGIRARNLVLNTLESRFGISRKKLYKNVASLQDANNIVNSYNENLDLSKFFSQMKNLNN